MTTLPLDAGWLSIVILITIVNQKSSKRHSTSSSESLSIHIANTYSGVNFCRKIFFAVFFFFWREIFLRIAEETTKPAKVSATRWYV